MAIASVSAISLMHIIWLPHESHAAMSLPSAVARAAIWLRRESKAHFGLPGYAPGTIAVKVTWIEREFNAGQMHRSMYVSIFNRLRAIARYWSEIATFFYPLALNPSVGGVSVGIPGKSLVLIKLESWGYQAVKTV